MRKILLSLTFLGWTIISNAQQVRPANSQKIYQEIAQLQHLVNDRRIPTSYLSLTRGDGGQNILGSEQGEALGLIRTHELMEARKIDGAEQFFSRAIDFGFSKNFDETFKHWNEDTLTSDA